MSHAWMGHSITSSKSASDKHGPDVEHIAHCAGGVGSITDRKTWSQNAVEGPAAWVHACRGRETEETDVKKRGGVGPGRV